MLIAVRNILKSWLLVLALVQKYKQDGPAFVPKYLELLSSGGSAAVVVLSDRDDMRMVALNLLKFFEDESCGQCTPCRVGTEKAVKRMREGPWDEALLTELSQAMRDASICGLGQAAPNPLLCVFKYFRDDLAQPLGRW